MIVLALVCTYYAVQQSTDPPFYMLGMLIRIANINSIKKLTTPFNL
jgi:hypothetical protein